MSGDCEKRKKRKARRNSVVPPVLFKDFMAGPKDKPEAHKRPKAKHKSKRRRAESLHLYMMASDKAAKKPTATLRKVNQVISLIKNKRMTLAKAKPTPAKEVKSKPRAKSKKTAKPMTKIGKKRGYKPSKKEAESAPAPEPEPTKDDDKKLSVKERILKLQEEMAAGDKQRVLAERTGYPKKPQPPPTKKAPRPESVAPPQQKTRKEAAETAVEEPAPLPPVPASLSRKIKQPFPLRNKPKENPLNRPAKKPRPAESAPPKEADKAEAKTAEVKTAEVKTAEAEASSDDGRLSEEGEEKRKQKGKPGRPKPVEEAPERKPKLTALPRVALLKPKMRCEAAPSPAPTRSLRPIQPMLYNFIAGRNRQRHDVDPYLIKFGSVPISKYVPPFF